MKSIKPPKFPTSRIIREGSIDFCPLCGSSMNTKWIIFTTDKCIQPECDNYFKSKVEERKRKIKLI